MVINFYRNVAVRYKFLLVFLVIVGILLVVGIYYLSVADSLSQSFTTLELQEQKAKDFSQLLSYNQDLQKAAQSFVISGDVKWDKIHTEVSIDLDKLLPQILDNLRDHQSRALLVRFDEIHSQLLGTELLILAKARSGELTEAAALFDQEYNDLQAETTRLVENTVALEEQKTVMVFADNRELLTTARTTFLAILAILIIAGLVVSYIGASLVAGPIIALSTVAQAIAGGALAQRVTVTSRDEIGQLASSFNSMADHLQKVIEDTQSKSKKLEIQNIELELIKERLEKAVTRLQRLDKVKSEFVSVAAHQLRTPMTGIKWSLHTLAEGDIGVLNKDQKRIIQEALKATVELVALINDLLNVARLEEKRLGFSFEKQPFLPLVNKAVARFQSIAAQKDVSITVDLPTTQLPPLMIDNKRITAVLNNLLDNAVKYTPPGGKVTVNVAMQKKHVMVTVTDTGIGIPQDQFPQVFTKFFRSKNAQLSETKGTGLGLYLAKQIIKQHGGKISFTSTLNQGSTFSFTLPLAGPATLHKKLKSNTQS